MSTNLRSILRKLVPPWAAPRPAVGDQPARDAAFKFLYTPALFADLSLEALIQGIQARLPLTGTPTALPRIGRDRVIRRGLTEPDDVYARRLVAWLDDWRHAGSAWSLMRQVQAYVWPIVPRLRVINNNGVFWTLNPDGTQERTKVADWDWDSNSGGDPDDWAKIWLVIYSTNGPYPWDREGSWDDGEAWDGRPEETWGSTATPEQVQEIQAIVEDWKAAHELCVNIVVALDTAVFDPTDNTTYPTDGLWGHWSKIVGGVSVPARDDRAIYWDC